MQWRHGGAGFEIFATVCPNTHETLILPVTLETDRERRTGRISIPVVGEIRAEPIRHPVTNEEHRARIVLPEGFEYEEAEMSNSRELRTSGPGPLYFRHENTYAQFNAFDWSNA